MLFQSPFVFSSRLAAAAASAVALLFPDGILYVYVVAEDSKSAFAWLHLLAPVPAVCPIIFIE